MIHTNNRSTDMRVIALLEKILEAIEALNNSIQESLLQGNAGIPPLPAPSTYAPSVPPPSRASSSCSTGITSFPSNPYSSVSLAGALKRASLQDNRRYTYGQHVPCEECWYCVIRGCQVGPIQGWENVGELTDGVVDAKYQRCDSQAHANDVYQKALKKLGNVRVLN